MSKPPEIPLEESPSRLRERLESYVPEFIRRSITAGVGGLMMTEEGVRNLVSEMKLPKEVAGNMIAQADRAKTEFFKIVASELRTFLEQMNIWEEMRKLLDGVSVDVEMKIRLHTQKGEEGTRLVPEVKVTQTQIVRNIEVELPPVESTEEGRGDTEPGEEEPNPGRG